MQVFFVAAAVLSTLTLGLAGRAAAQGTAAARGPAAESQRLALATGRPAPARLACAPLVGQVFDPDGQPLLGATLLVNGTHDVYVTNAAGQFQLTQPVYADQVLTVQAAGFVPQEIALTDCTLPRLVLARDPDARIRHYGKRTGQVIRRGGTRF